MAKRVGVLCVAIILLFIAFVLIPKREFSIPVFPLRIHETLMVYDDISDGGSSVSKMEISDSVLDFRCTLGMDTSKGAWCGLIWTFSGEDTVKNRYENWSLVDSIVFKIYSEKKNEIIAKVWTYDPDVTNEDSLHTFRQMLKEIPLEAGENEITIPFEDFYVPEFWFQQTGADKELCQRHKEHVARFEITPGWDVKRGEPLHIQILQISAKGTGSLELAIFLGACLVIIVVIFGFLKKKK
ncbi:MAG: CIA30 family protein [Fibrobacter sp.]|nr:CIA30 family protein [Fibrobacter sp.]